MTLRPIELDSEEFDLSAPFEQIAASKGGLYALGGGGVWKSNETDRVWRLLSMSREASHANGDVYTTDIGFGES